MQGSRNTFAVALIATACLSSNAQAPATPAPQTSVTASPQQMLDFLAKPLPASSRMALPANYPVHFAEWSEEQKRAGLQSMTQRCGLIFALEHDNPAARMVPASMTKLEEAELAMAVCLPAKMPGDWPDRRKYLTDAQRLIAKADAAGAELTMPDALAHEK